MILSLNVRFFFFFSSRRRHTRWPRDWSSDVCSSDLAKVLRALQENKITRVGGDRSIPVNVRVVAATNKDLMEEIEQNNFREDLYHRLSVILIHVPPLRERRDDVPIIPRHFASTLARRNEIARASC